MTAQTEKALVMNQTVYFQSSTFGKKYTCPGIFPRTINKKVTKSIQYSRK